LHVIFDKYAAAEKATADLDQQGVTERPEFTSSAIDKNDAKAKSMAAEKAVLEEGVVNNNPDSSIESEQPVVDSISKDEFHTRSR